MSESILKSILEESARLEWDKYENVPEHKFSLKHRLAMKRILSAAKSAPNVVATRRTVQKRSLKRTLLIAAVLVFLAVIVGAVVVFRSQNFHGTVYQDYTQMFSANIEGSSNTNTL